MHQLWVKLCTHPNVKHIVNDFNDQELSVRIEMDFFNAGSTEWCMCEMKRHMLLDQCKKECIEHLYNAPTHSDRCKQCDTVYFIDNKTSTKVCKGCGISIDILLDDKLDYSTRDRFNGNRRHHYDPSEHFAQTIFDFTCTGARKIPVNVLAYCRAVVGSGLHVSSENVFTALKMGGFRNYYLHKYEITNRLRGKPEFQLTSREIANMRAIYKRYRYEFIPFQQAHCIGTVSMSGKPRIFWPIRYILKKICEEVGRCDVVIFIRGVCDKQKLEIYDKYWNMLTKFINDTRPKLDRVDPSLSAVQLRPRRHLH